MNYFQNILNISCEDYFLIPVWWGGPFNFYSFTFKGWKFSLDYSDDSMNQVMSLLASNVNNFIHLYKKTHAFTEPQLILEIDGTVIAKIATMELEIYHQMMEKNKPAL